MLHSLAQDPRHTDFDLLWQSRRSVHTIGDLQDALGEGAGLFVWEIARGIDEAEGVFLIYLAVSCDIAF